MSRPVHPDWMASHPLPRHLSNPVCAAKAIADYTKAIEQNKHNGAAYNNRRV